MKNRVRIIAPAWRCAEKSQEKLAEIVGFLKSHKFEVSVQDNIFANPPLPYFANIKSFRLQGLRDAISSEDVDIIWAFRGGSGCGEIADECMDLKDLVGNKILIGASDITALHTLFNQHYNLPSIHGPVLITLADKHPSAIEEIINILNETEQKFLLKALNSTAQKSSQIKGELIGGNLTVFSTLIGTKLHPKTEGKILLLEDVSEKGYKIQRMLTQLEKSDLLKGLLACILGDFTAGDEYVDYAINEFVLSHPDLPIFRVEGVGHGYINHPIVLGNIATIEDGVLSCKLG